MPGPSRKRTNIENQYRKGRLTLSKNQTLELQIADILIGVDKAAKKAIKEAIETVPAQTSKRLRETSPRGGGKYKGSYASGWRVKRVGKAKEAVVYNSRKPSLTHLLEDGHVIKNQYGQYGRVNGTKHIQPARDEAWDKIDKVIDEVLAKEGIE